MKRIHLHRVVPAALMAAATAIPIATTVEILAHVSAGQAATLATSTAPAPATSTASSSASSAPTATAAPAISTTAPATSTSAPATSSSAAASTPTTQPAATATQPAATPTAQATATQPAATATPATARTYAGPVEYDQYGAVQATITVSGGKVTAVAISAPEDNPRSADINTQAIPILQSETLQAQSASIDIVSGATYTSQAYEQSLQAALDQAHLS